MCIVLVTKIPWNQSPVARFFYLCLVQRNAFPSQGTHTTPSVLGEYAEQIAQLLCNFSRFSPINAVDMPRLA